MSLENYFSAVEAGKSYRSEYILPGKKWATLITSRGCPYGCVFCAINLTMGKKWRPRSAENVVEEIEELVYKYSIGHLTIEDDNMTLDMSRAKQICDLIIQKKFCAAEARDSRQLPARCRSSPFLGGFELAWRVGAASS